MTRFFLVLTILFLSMPAWAQDEHALSFAGNARPYLVHTPPGYNTDLSHPVIIALHGGGGNAAQFMESSNLNPAADKAGMLAVYPSGYPGARRDDMRTWNAGACCATALARQSDDVGYIGAVLDDLARHYNIDKKRIYVTGHSNGAMMAYKLSCAMADRIAAIAPVGGQSVVKTCQPARAIPVMHIHGTADECAVYGGGKQCGGCFAAMAQELTGRAIDTDSMSWPCDPVPQSLAARAALYECREGPATARSEGAMTCERWSACRDGATVTLCSIEGAGHAWPGGTEPRMCQRRPEGRLCENSRARTGGPGTVDAAAMVVDFFRSLR